MFPMISSRSAVESAILFSLFLKLLLKWGSHYSILLNIRLEVIKTRAIHVKLLLKFPFFSFRIQISLKYY